MRGLCLSIKHLPPHPNPLPLVSLYGERQAFAFEREHAAAFRGRILAIGSPWRMSRSFRDLVLGGCPQQQQHEIHRRRERRFLRSVTVIFRPWAASSAYSYCWRRRPYRRRRLRISRERDLASSPDTISNATLPKNLAWFDTAARRAGPPSGDNGRKGPSGAWKAAAWLSRQQRLDPPRILPQPKFR